MMTPDEEPQLPAGPPLEIDTPAGQSDAHHHTSAGEPPPTN